MQWAVIRDLLTWRALHRPETQVLGERGDDVVLLNHLVGCSEFQGIPADLNEVWQSIDRQSTSTQCKVLPPGIGGQGAV